MLPVVHHPDYLVPLKPGHRFPISKYGYLREALVARGLIAPKGHTVPSPATAAQVGLAHDPAYVARVLTQRLAPGEIRRIGLPATELVARRARLASGGTLLAAWLALEHGLALNAAGGSHHAGPDGGAGYCVFNDVAVAVANLLAQGMPGPVLVIDADVHQGDGTARIFASEPRVFTFSIHAQRNFPARKAVSDLDIALADGTGDEDYLEAFRSGVAQALAAARPRIVFYNGGVDVWGGDRLGRLALTDAGIRARDAHAIAAVRAQGLPFVGVLGGGYDDDPRRLAARHAILFEEAAAYA